MQKERKFSRPQCLLCQKAHSKCSRDVPCVQCQKKAAGSGMDASQLCVYPSRNETTLECRANFVLSGLLSEAGPLLGEEQTYLAGEERKRKAVELQKQAAALSGKSRREQVQIRAAAEQERKKAQFERTVQECEEYKVDVEEKLKAAGFIVVKLDSPLSGGF